MLHTETVEAGTLGIIRQLLKDEVFKDFYLVGGTALSLKLGHRKSIDIDLFTHESFDARKIKEHLEKNYQVDEMRARRHGTFGYINKIKLDVVSHKYPPQRSVENIDGIRMLSLEDLGAMKLHAIVQNGARLKDFVDFNYLLEHKSLSDLLKVYESKYPESNKHIAQHALLYHNDIDFSFKVQSVKGEIRWEKIDRRLRDAVINPGKMFKSEFSQDQKKSKELKQKPNIEIQKESHSNKKGRRPRL